MIGAKKFSFEFKTKVLFLLKKIGAKELFLIPDCGDKRRAFIFLAADYGNLGDVAIARAQKQFLLENSTDAEIVEIPISKTLEGLIAVKKRIKKGDLITIVGGGNFGDLYPQIEYYRQFVVKSFPNNKIICFPQSIYYSDTTEGNKALQKARAVYRKHNNLVLVAREVFSFQKMTDCFTDTKVVIAPDIVFYLKEKQISEKRDGVIFTFRDDAEKLMTATQTEEIKLLTKQYFQKSDCIDTHIAKPGITKNEYGHELDSLINSYKNAELIVTDRLHGMILSYVTNTPCIVFPCKNNKVEGSFKWIENSTDVYFFKVYSKDQLHEVLEKLSANNHSGFELEKSIFAALKEMLK